MSTSVDQTGEVHDLEQAGDVFAFGDCGILGQNRGKSIRSW